MHNEMTPAHRLRVSTIAEAKRSASRMVSPYLGPIAQWNSELALLRGLVQSSRLRAVEQHTARAQLADMLEDVRLAHRRFRDAMDGQPVHGLTDDMNKSFSRLSRQLRETMAILDCKTSGAVS